jgi:hypothetical protein
MIWLLGNTTPLPVETGDIILPWALITCGGDIDGGWGGGGRFLGMINPGRTDVYDIILYLLIFGGLLTILLLKT